MGLAGTSNLPVAPKDTPWNARAAKERIFEACDGKVACIQRGFLWRNGGDPRDPSAWSLPFADVIDGRLHIIPRGIAACAGVRGIGSMLLSSQDKTLVQARIAAVYDRVRKRYEEWPTAPFQALTADANGTALEGTIALEGVDTGDGRFIENGALTWDELPVPLVFDRAEMDHSGATIGTINEVERRKGGVIWARGALSDSEDPETQLLVLRAAELFAEGAVGVSVSLDDIEDNIPTDPEQEWPEVVRVKSARIRSVAVVDEAAFIEAKMGLVASLRQVKTEWFSDPNFGNGSQSHHDDGGDDRLVWQEPERAEEEGQFGCPLTITDDGHIYGHAALWYRCHVGYMGTCVRPPKEPAAYKGFLTGDRTGKGIPTGPLVFKTRHAPDHLSADVAAIHYDHTGHAPGDVTIGPDAYGIWVSGALRVDTTPAEIDILRASALSGDWRPVGNKHRLVGLLAVNAPGFRVARALAASGALITVGPGCSECDSQPSLEDRLATLERIVADGIIASLPA
jgi:hypothetical protein